jgi:hypothetical protein
VVGKGKTVCPRFQRTSRPQEQMYVNMIRRLRRAGPKLPGQFQQGMQITKSCMFHAKVTAGARQRLTPSAIVMKKACVYWGIRRLYSRASQNKGFAVSGCQPRTPRALRK